MPRRRLILAIETSNPSAWTPQSPLRPGVALGEIDVSGAARVIATQDVDPTRRDDELHTAIDRLFADAGAAPADLSRIGVSAGPGGFTSVRIAVTTAKLLAHALGAQIVPVCSAAVAAGSATRGGPLAVALASKGQDAWVRTFDAEARPTSEGRVMTAQDLRGLEIQRLVADSFLPPSFAAAAHELRIAVEPPVFDPAVCLRLAALGPPVDPLALAPVYPRPPEAVRKWLELHGRPENRAGA